MTNDEYVELSGNALRRLSIIRDRIITLVRCSAERPDLAAMLPLLKVQEQIMTDIVDIDNEFMQPLSVVAEVES